MSDTKFTISTNQDALYKYPYAGDRLTDLFAMQTQLNNYTFKKHNIRDRAQDVLTMGTLQDLVTSDGGEELDKSPNSLTNEWLLKYHHALLEEVKEIGEALPWKWWSKSEIDIPHIQEEIVDALHFLISISITSGMDAPTLFNKYIEKNKVNLARQDSNYVARNG